MPKVRPAYMDMALMQRHWVIAESIIDWLNDFYSSIDVF